MRNQITDLKKKTFIKIQPSTGRLTLHSKPVLSATDAENSNVVHVQDGGKANISRAYKYEEMYLLLLKAKRRLC